MKRRWIHFSYWSTSDFWPTRIRSGARHWIEVWLDGAWRPYAIEQGVQGIPASYFPWWRGLPNPVSVEGAAVSGIVFSLRGQVKPQVGASMALARIQDNPICNFTLFALPVEVQQVYRVLLLVPIGALVLRDSSETT